MGLADTVRNAVATAHALTADLQATVTHRAWTGQDETGKATYASAVSRTAIVEQRQRMLRQRDGTEIMTAAMLTFLAPIAANGAATRREPIDPRDVFTLPDGTSGPVVDVAGLTDAGSASGASFYYQVAIGLPGSRAAG